MRNVKASGERCVSMMRWPLLTAGGRCSGFYESNVVAWDWSCRVGQGWFRGK